MADIVNCIQEHKEGLRRALLRPQCMRETGRGFAVCGKLAKWRVTSTFTVRISGKLPYVCSNSLFFCASHPPPQEALTKMRAKLVLV